MDIATGLSSLTAAIGLVKELRSIDVQIDKAALKLKIAELTGALADAKVAMVDASETLRSREDELAKLRQALDFRATKLVDKGQFRYFADDSGNATGTPICPRCEQKGEHLAVVQDRSKGAGRITYYCPGCRSNYGSHVPRGSS